MKQSLIRIMQLIAENTVKPLDSKGEIISFCDFLCAPFYARLRLNYFKNITRGHREALENKSFYKIKTSLRALRFYLTKNSRIAFSEWSLFSACSNTTQFSPSITSSVISSPLWAGRQCSTIASFWAHFKSLLFI